MTKIKVDLDKIPEDFTVSRKEVHRETRRVRLLPRSSHGQNRVHHQGDTWTVLNEANSVSTTKHRKCEGPFILCENAGNIRWVSTTDDPDFIVEEVT